MGAVSILRCLTATSSHKARLSARSVEKDDDASGGRVAEDRRAAFARLREETRRLRRDYALVVSDHRAGAISRAEEAAMLAAIASEMRLVYREMRALLPGIVKPLPR
jgi:hypothetical protein